jgi:predicted O-methyltransferase YrrM
MPHQRAQALKHAVVGAIPPRVVRILLETLETRQDISEAAGFHVYPRTYYSPLLLKEEIDLTVLEQRRRLPGVSLNEQAAVALVETLSSYGSELDTLPYESNGKAPYWFANDWYNDFDAASLYALIRLLKPKRYVELGCGFSSLISTRALSRNIADGFACDAVYADPHPRVDIAKLLTCGRLLEHRVQSVPFELFTSLGAGDVLFIDTSHVVKFQSDVVHAFVAILPSLKPGVWIHVHDIFTPYDYPRDWITQSRFSNNEQYALEALLSGGDRYDVALPLYLLWKEQIAVLKQLLPRGRRRPQGFWLRRTAVP